MNILNTPISEEDIKKLKVGDMVYVSGNIFCGRDMVLPKIVELIKNGREDELGVDLYGGAILHTAVSIAGIGPTSSNKIEIEDSIIPLSEAGVKLHIGKGKISDATIEGLAKNNSIYAIVPPVSALLGKLVTDRSVILFPELGMEAFYLLVMERMPIIVAAAHGENIYDR